MARKKNPNDYAHYMGDVNLEHGGYFYRIDGDSAEVLRVSPFSEGGPWNEVDMWLVERCSVDLDIDRKRAGEIGSTIGLTADEVLNGGPEVILDAVLWYGGYDSDVLTVIAELENHRHAPYEAFGVVVEYIRDASRLLPWLQRRGYLRDFK